VVGDDTLLADVAVGHFVFPSDTDRNPGSVK